jgi:hypothetical protein
LKPGESLLELAVRTGSNPWSLVQANELTGSAQAVLGESLVFQSPDGESLSSLDGVVRSIEITPLPLVQGRTTTIQIETLSPAGFTGQLGDAPLHFFSSGQNQAIALQGIHAMLDPGIIPLTIQGRAEDGAEFSYTQMVRVISGNYIQDLPLNVPPATIDPANTGPENELWANIFVEATPDKRWEGGFAFPSKIATLQYCLDTGDCWTSFFGNRRSYNGSPYQYFHTGLDIAGQTGAEILAPAPGIVVFTGELTVRGGATVIDHGWGVYTAYEHQSDIQVEVGDVVETGQVIGLVGATGRVEGPHLHWEVVVGGVAVDPLDWLERVYP